MALQDGKKENAKWRAQLAEWEERHGLPPGLALWTSRVDFVGAGLPRTERAYSLVDVVCAEKVKQSQHHFVSVSEDQLKRLMTQVVVDFSQNPCRHACSNADNTLPCLTSSSRLYAYNQDRVLTGMDHFGLQGWDLDTLVQPSDVPENKFREMAGQGMCVQSIASVLWSLYCVKQYPS